jgi:hypothetical protein
MSFHRENALHLPLSRVNVPTTQRQCFHFRDRSFPLRPMISPARSRKVSKGSFA